MRAPSHRQRGLEKGREKEMEEEMEEEREVEPEFSIWMSCSSCSEKSLQDVVRRLLSAMGRTSGCDTGIVFQ